MYAIIIRQHGGTGQEVSLAPHNGGHLITHPVFTSFYAPPDEELFTARRDDIRDLEPFEDGTATLAPNYFAWVTLLGHPRELILQMNAIFINQHGEVYPQVMDGDLLIKHPKLPLFHSKIGDEVFSYVGLFPAYFSKVLLLTPLVALTQPPGLTTAYHAR